MVMSWYRLGDKPLHRTIMNQCTDAHMYLQTLMSVVLLIADINALNMQLGDGGFQSYCGWAIFAPNLTVSRTTLQKWKWALIPVYVHLAYVLTQTKWYRCLSALAME